MEIAHLCHLPLGDDWRARVATRHGTAQLCVAPNVYRPPTRPVAGPLVKEAHRVALHCCTALTQSLTQICPHRGASTG